MATKTGVNANTEERILMGPGAVYINSVLLGATKGGNVLEINRTLMDIRPDGAKGPVKGFRKIEEVTAKLTVRLVEVTEEAIVYALAGSSISTHVVTGGEIDNDTYITEVSIDAEITGVTASTEMASVEVALSNCLVEGPFTIDMAESGETVIELVFTAHFDPSTLTTEPWSITFTPAT